MAAGGGPFACLGAICNVFATSNPHIIIAVTFFGYRDYYGIDLAIYINAEFKSI